LQLLTSAGVSRQRPPGSHGPLGGVGLERRCPPSAQSAAAPPPSPCTPRPVPSQQAQAAPSGRSPRPGCPGLPDALRPAVTVSAPSLRRGQVHPALVRRLLAQVAASSPPRSVRGQPASHSGTQESQVSAAKPNHALQGTRRAADPSHMERAQRAESLNSCVRLGWRHPGRRSLVPNGLQLLTSAGVSRQRPPGSHGPPGGRQSGAPVPAVRATAAAPPPSPRASESGFRSAGVRGTQPPPASPRLAWPLFAAPGGQSRPRVRRYDAASCTGAGEGVAGSRLPPAPPSVCQRATG
jgi:hypothetical protein